MSDVTAIILSLGEDYTERAIASVRRQSLPPAEIIVVRGISPFHRAFNSAVSQVRSEFFIQVDADMILDNTCIADLRRCMSDRVGIVVGHLRDSLLGRIVGIKLFRKLCCDRVMLQDSLSSETDSAEDILKDGWTTIYPAKYSGARGTFGEHRPDYNPHYAFCKFMRDGAKARYRKDGRSLRRVFRRLQGSEHKVATIATIGAAHGIFIKEKRDLHGPLMHSDEFEFLQRFLMTGEENRVERFLPENLLRGNLQKVFARFYKLGIQLRRSCVPLRLATQIRHLQKRHSIASWVALVGVCHGLFFDRYDEAEAEEAFVLLKDLLPTYHFYFRY